MSMKLQTDEKIEGLGDPASDVEEAVYPLDDIMVRAETRTVGDVVVRIKRGRYAMAPDFQRDFVWDSKKQSKLIESCIMRIPLPVLYVAEGSDGRIVVVDGLQRLTTFVRFLSDELTLTGLGDYHPLKGQRFSQLPVNLQERVEDTQLTLYILDKSAPQRAQLDIFERVNSGATLSRQQMRNAILNGQGTRWLYDMSKSKPFLDATGRSLNTKIMRDREAINRFAGFHVLGWKSYEKADIDDFLARTLNRLNGSNDQYFATLTTSFFKSMRLNYQVFGQHSFRKSLAEPKGNKSLINIALFDVLSWSFARLHEGLDDHDLREVGVRVVDLVCNEEFYEAITRGTNNTRQVQTRFKMAEDQLLKWSEA